jgi:hypothetical protein
MSRTYRRTNKGRKATWLPNIYESDYYGGTLCGYSWAPKIDAVEFIQKHPKYYNDIGNYFHWMTTPSHWNHDFHTVPRRAKERQLTQKIKKGELDPDDTVWPDGKKPHIYYW